MRTTPNLGLKVWDLSTDPYEHDDLALNWDKIDALSSGVAGLAAAARSVRQITTLTPGTNGPVNPPANGDLCICLSAVASFAADTLIRYNGATWRSVGGLELLSALPTTENFVGRVVLLTSASGSFSSGDLVRNTDGANAWTLVGPLARSSASGVTGYETTGDIYINSTAQGLILKDRTNGKKYRLFFTGGGFSQEEVT